MTPLDSQGLSPFQLLMREWATLAPYNFIHAMRLSAPCDIHRWQTAVDTTMRELGISAKIALEQPTLDLETHFERELNRSFYASEAPFRFFAINANSNGHWFGTVIDHWVFDDFSCRRLLQRIYSLYRGDRGDISEAQSIKTPAASPRSSLWFSWPKFLKQIMVMRRAWRTPMRDPADLQVGTFRVALPEGVLQASKRLAKANDATLHDLFLAATAQAFGAAGRWEPSSRRDAVAVASAADVRRFEPESRRCELGLFIGQYIVIERRPHEVSLPELSRRIAAQTRRLKSKPGLDLFGPALLLWQMSHSRRAKAEFFSRSAPLAAGLSNVDLTGSWIERSGLADYRRLGPTGPVVPMIIMVTTLNGRIFMEVTFRTTAFTVDQARSLIADVVNRLPNGAA